MGVVEKLKERKVVQWTAGYFAVAWGALEVLSFLAAQFGWPAFVVRVATVILGAGLFAVIIVAWNHGDRGRQKVSANEVILLAALLFGGGTLAVFVAQPGGDDQAIVAGPVTRLTVTLPKEQRLALAGSYRYPMAVSPDGTLIAYVAGIDGKAQLALRSLDSFEATVLPGTEGAKHPFFAPDGKRLGFFADGRLLRAPLDGGAPVVVTEIDAPPMGGSWGQNGQILYSQRGDGLWLVSAEGGTPRKIAPRLAQADVSGDTAPAALVTGGYPVWPSILPDGEHALATDRDGAFMFSLETGEGHRLSESRNQTRYVRSGHLLFTVGEERLLAAPFDLDSLQITGPSFTVLEDVFRAPGGGAILFDVSQNGTLAFVSGGFSRSLALSDQYGRTELLTEDRRGFRFPRFSPDGQRVVVTIDPRPSDLWLYDVTRGVGEPLTADGHNILPLWPPGSARIVFYRNRLVYSMDPGDPNSMQQLSPDEGSDNLYPQTMSVDRQIVYGNYLSEESLFDIYAIEIGDPATFRPHISTPANDYTPRLSRDDEWMAFASDVSGRSEVYVEPHQGKGPRARVSIDGGTEPVWSHDGSRLYFRDGSRIMSALVDNRSPLSFAEPELMFVSPELDTTQQGNWDVGPGGRIVLVQSDPTTNSEFQVVLNWFGALTEAGTN